MGAYIAKRRASASKYNDNDGLGKYPPFRHVGPFGNMVEKFGLPRCIGSLQVLIGVYSDSD